MTDELAVFQRLPALFDADLSLPRRAARAQITMLVTAGAARCRLMLHNGVLSTDKADGPMDGWDIALRGDAGVWVDHWRKMPPPDAADVFRMSRHGRLVIEGNFLPLMRHLQLVKDILALPRATA